jgi:hypothetical protein
MEDAQPAPDGFAMEALFESRQGRQSIARLESS